MLLTVIAIAYYLVLIIVSAINLATIYHFIQYRYPGDLSIWFVIVFVILNLIVLSLPIILTDSPTNQLTEPIPII